MDQQRKPAATKPAVPSAPDAATPRDHHAHAASYCRGRYPDELRAAEAKLIAARREAARVAGPPPSPAADPLDPVGVAISGGGIRSATFALGLFQSLARRELVRKIDLLSTVSGGGYFGAFLGRLFGRDYVTSAAGGAGGATVAATVEQIVGERVAPAQPGGAATEEERLREKPVGQLRQNGHYLAPQGGGDALFAAAALIRNWLAFHVVLIVTLVALFLVPRMVEEAPCWRQAIAGARAAAPWFAPMAVALAGAALLLAVALPSVLAYWLLRLRADARRKSGGWLTAGPTIPAVMALLAAAFLGAFGAIESHPSGAAKALWWSIAALAAAGYAIAWIAIANAKGNSARERFHAARLGLTKTIATFGALAAAFVAAALVRWAAAWIHQNGISTAMKSVAGMVGGAGAIASLAKSLLFSSGPEGRRRRPAPWESLLASLGAGAWLALLLVCGDLVARTVADGTLATLMTVPSDVPVPAGASTASALFGSPAVGWIGADLAVAALLALLVGQYFAFVNDSSQHGLYARRLTRAYLGASNRARLGSASTALLSDAIPGDDVELSDYAPHAAGGPLHLINTTINETIDGRVGVQFLDRHGLGLAVGPCGMTAGSRHHFVVDSWKRWQEACAATGSARVADAQHDRGFAVFGSRFAPERLSVGTWVAISGAAFSTGLGAQTNLAMSLLCGLANVRLGYWFDSHQAPRGQTGGALLRGLGELFTVQAHLMSELLARFRGTSRRWWYLTDGGHFENMGGYELIRRRVRRIVVVDGECDASYAFEGLANLVRLARVDFGAEIEFLGESELDELLHVDVRMRFGSLESLKRGRWVGVDGPDAKRAAAELAPDDDGSEPRENGFSLAHAAVARVTYRAADDGATPASEGVLIYVKTTLRGDEPTDLLHYHAAHPTFPHESTADQFFDEPQWESYRKLGEVIGERLFGKEPASGAPAAERSDAVAKEKEWRPEQLFDRPLPTLPKKR